MKLRILLLACLTACTGIALRAQDGFNGSVAVSDLTLRPDGSTMKISMNMGLSTLGVTRNRAVVVTPRLVHGNDSIDLPSVSVYGRRRYFYYVRNGQYASGNAAETTLRTSQLSALYAYEAGVPYAEWMNGARLVLTCREYGCCRELLAQGLTPIGGYRRAQFRPQLLFVSPEVRTDAAVKTGVAQGEAYVDFPVSQTVIRPEYRNNTVELAKICATIDSVRNDPDYTITSLAIKGFASPEGSYANNERLARERTKALCDYVGRLYSLPQGFIRQSYEPENWEGLRRYVVAANITNKQGILDIIDSGIEPDARELRLRTAYPEEYHVLKELCYPALRRSNYSITYNIRKFTEVRDIRRLLKEAPGKLDLNECNMALKDMETGSAEYREAVETIARLYPGDATSNVNAASVALADGNLTTAATYLARAGESPEARYLRAIHAALSGDKATAIGLLEPLAGQLAQADDALRQLRNLDHNGWQE